MNELKIVWHPYPQEKTKEEGYYLTAVRVAGTNYINKDSYCINKKHEYFAYGNSFVIAWAELPEPYTGNSC